MEVWKRSCRLSVEIYKLAAECRDYGFKDHLSRSALSVSSNIAEGYERGSRKEYIRFLNIAKGPCGEMRTQLYIGIEAGTLSRGIAAQYVARVQRTIQNATRSNQ